MPETLELEEIERENSNHEDSMAASWLIEIPSNIIAELDLPLGSKAALTIRGDEISGNILPPMSDEIKGISSRILEKRRDVYKELERLGD